MSTDVLIKCFENRSFDNVTIEQWNKILNPYIEWFITMARPPRSTDIPLFAHVYIPEGFTDLVDSFNLMIATMIADIHHLCEQGYIVHSNFVGECIPECEGHTVRVTWRASQK
jgi:hypothetical protein